MKTFPELVESFKHKLADYPFSSPEEAHQEGLESHRLAEPEGFTALETPFSMHTPAAKHEAAAAEPEEYFEESSSEGESTGEGEFYGDLKLDLDLTMRGKTIVEGSQIVIPVNGKCGLVGRNGTGKTSILKAMLKRRFGMPKGLRIHAIRQDYVSNETLQEFVGSDAGKALRGLGFTPDKYNQRLCDFSGGWRMRAQLARSIHEDPDLLLLDEPTNFLDIEGIAYLESKMREMKRVIIVSHDRRFLDSTVSKVFHLEDRKINVYNGNYSAFISQRDAALERLRREHEAQVADKEHLQAFINKFRYSAKRAAQAQSKIKLLEKMQDIVPPKADPKIRFNFRSRKAGGVLVELSGVSFAYRQDSQAILQNIDLRIDHTTRMVIVGRNGEGKSTLLKLLSGRLEPVSGRIERCNNFVAGYFAQHHADAFDQNRQAIEVVSECLEGSRREELGGKAVDEVARAAMARFGLNVCGQRIGTLSGGQKSRLGFTLLDILQPNVLVLDEPTNHLDVEMIDALADALVAFKGAVICVSHDVAFVEKVFNEVFVCESGMLRRFKGTVNDYKASIRRND